MRVPAATAVEVVKYEGMDIHGRERGVRCRYYDTVRRLVSEHIEGLTEVMARAVVD